MGKGLQIIYLKTKYVIREWLSNALVYQAVMKKVKNKAQFYSC